MTETLIVEAVKNQLSLYPKSTLRDVYKSFFQDEYGPGHLLDDLTACRHYFDHELKTMVSKGYYASEPCGLGKQFFRFSLDCVIDGLVDVDTFFSAFVQGSANLVLPETRVWAERWAKIHTAILPIKNLMADFDADAQLIVRLLQNNQAVMHHSEQFVAAYDPHYRIMSIEVLKFLTTSYSQPKSL